MNASGIAMIMTRPEGANEAFLQALDPALLARVDVVFSPLIQIVQTGAAPAIGLQDGVIFTSANAVRFAPPGKGRPAFCVGQATREAAAKAGWAATFVAPDSAGFVDALSEMKPGMRLHHLCGVHARGDVAERLQAKGLTVHRLSLYDQALLPLTAEAGAALAKGKPVLVPLFSPRTARQFSHECRDPGHVNVVALSGAIADALGALPIASLEIALEPTADTVAAILEKLIRSHSLG